MSGQHLHRDDYAETLRTLEAVLVHRRHNPVGLEDIGYRHSDTGVWVDWDGLEHSWLSSTEQAAVVVVRGIAMAERQGGGPSYMTRALVEAIARIGGGG